MRSSASWGVTAVVAVLAAAAGLLVGYLLFNGDGAAPEDDRADGVVVAGSVDDFRVNEPVFFEEGFFWLVRLDDERFVALFAKDPFLGCTLPWRERIRFEDPATGQSREGWFRDPCHGSTYDLDGSWVGGPAERDMDRFPVEVESGVVRVYATPENLERGHPIIVRQWPGVR